MKDSITLDQFLSRFLTAPKGSSPEAIKAKVLHWISTANTTDDAARRRTARQNVRRLATRYPQVVSEIAATVAPEEVLR